MSPEQATGRPVDHRSDLFSLGVVLYEMVSGKSPFSGNSTLETLSRISTTQPERIIPIRKDCPIELERIIFRCLEKDPEARYQTARELLLDLQGLTKRRTRPRVARFAVPALLIVVAAAVGFWIPRLKRESASSPAPARIQSVAVLPFVNMSAQSENEFIADGLTEEVINALAQLPDLKVVSRTSAFAFKGKNADIREIGQKLDVESVVEGSLRRSGNKLRVTAQLVKVKDGYHLWSDTYDRELTDVFAIQDEIASSVARALQARLTPGQKLVGEPTRDVEAYELYLKGRQASGIWTRESLEKSVMYFRQAIARDPSFAGAYGGLAEAYSLMDHAAEGPPDDPEEIYRSAIAAARRALELDPDSVDAHAALGHIYLHQVRLADAERHLKRALELNPNSASARQWYSILLRFMGRYQEALEQIVKARELDPLSVQINYFTAGGFFYAGDLDGAIEAGRRGIEIAPDYAPFYLEIAGAYALKHNHAEAEKILNQAARLPNPPPNLDENRAFHLALANRRAEALSLLDKMARQEKYRSPKTIAAAYAALGETEKALQWLQRLLRENPNFGRLNLELGPYPPFDGLRRDPRYRDLRKRVGLPDLPQEPVGSVR